jgi:hypothetical protein
MPRKEKLMVLISQYSLRCAVSAGHRHCCYRSSTFGCQLDTGTRFYCVTSRDNHSGFKSLLILYIWSWHPKVICAATSRGNELMQRVEKFMYVHTFFFGQNLTGKIDLKKWEKWPLTA